MTCVRRYLIVVLTCIALVINDADFLCTCWPYVCFFWKNICSDPLPFFLIGLFNYLPLEKRCLAYYWALVETDCLTMGHQVAMGPELPIMFWVFSGPLRHIFGCIQQHSLIQWKIYIYMCVCVCVYVYVTGAEQALKSQVKGIKNRSECPWSPLLLHCLPSLSMNLWLNGEFPLIS